MIQSMHNVLYMLLNKNVEDSRARIAEQEKKLAENKRREDIPFEQADELRDKKARITELDGVLSTRAEEKVDPKDEPVDWDNLRGHVRVDYTSDGEGGTIEKAEPEGAAVEPVGQETIKQPDKYYIKVANKFEEARGATKVVVPEHEDLDLFVSKVSSGEWVISEGKTGARIVSAPSKPEVIEKIREIIPKGDNRDRINKFIENQLSGGKKSLSPRYRGKIKKQLQEGTDEQGKSLGTEEDRKGLPEDGRRGVRPERQLPEGTGNPEDVPAEGSSRVQKNRPASSPDAVMDDFRKGVAEDIGKPLSRNAIKLEPLPDDEEYRVAEGMLDSVFGKRLITFRETGELKFKAPGKSYGAVLVDGHPGDVLINVSLRKPVIVSAAHEAWHIMEEERPDLTDAVKEIMLEEASPEFSAERDRKGKLGYQPEEATDETIAEIIGETFTKKSFWDKLADRNPEAFKYLADAMKKIIGKVRDWMFKASRVNNPEKYFRDFERVENAIADAYAKYAKEKPVEVKTREPEDLSELMELSGYKNERAMNRAYGRHSLEEHGETKGEFLQRVICGGRIKL